MASLIVAVVAVIVSVVSVAVAVKARGDSRKSAEVAAAQRHDQLAPQPQWKWRVKGSYLYLYDDEEPQHYYRTVSHLDTHEDPKPENSIAASLRPGSTSEVIWVASLDDIQEESEAKRVRFQHYFPVKLWLSVTFELKKETCPCPRPSEWEFKMELPKKAEVEQNL